MLSLLPRSNLAVLLIDQFLLELSWYGMEALSVLFQPSRHYMRYDLQQD